MKKDNAGKREKLALRRTALEWVDGPQVILEAYAGEGVIWKELYTEAEGVAFEKDETKCRKLVRQRPSWRVYEADCVPAIAQGVASDIAFNYVDIDPYGDPWPAIDAVLLNPRALAPLLVIAVNDGLRQGIKMGISWKVKSMAPAVRRFGHDLHDVYIDVCKWMMELKAGEAGYDLTHFRGFYGGHAKQMTHYYAVLQKR